MGDIISKCIGDVCTCWGRNKDVTHNIQITNDHIIVENECNLYHSLYHDELYSQINNYTEKCNRTYIDI